jgi:hypothetical protein
LSRRRNRSAAGAARLQWVLLVQVPTSTRLSTRLRVHVEFELQRDTMAIMAAQTLGLRCIARYTSALSQHRRRRRWLPWSLSASLSAVLRSAVSSPASLEESSSSRGPLHRAPLQTAPLLTRRASALAAHPREDQTPFTAEPGTGKRVAERA